MQYKSQAPQVSQNILCPREMKQVKAPGNAFLYADVVIAITLHNQSTSIRRALKSALSQSLVVNKRALVLIFDDQSTDEWTNKVSDLLSNPAILIISGKCGSPARARNAVLDYVDANLKQAKWVARLDADDSLADPGSVAALLQAGTDKNALFVLGSNKLKIGDDVTPYVNKPNANILTPGELVKTIEGFCLHGQQQELPSCNLLLATQSGFRYPNIRSAEDHWLAAILLIFHNNRGAIAAEPTYAIYTLNGAYTQLNQKEHQWRIQRKRLAEAVRTWYELIEQGKDILGIGQEGIVWLENGRVHKKYYSWSMNHDTVQRLKSLLKPGIIHLPYPDWFKSDSHWFCSYDETFLTEVPQKLPLDTIKNYLNELYKAGIATNNIKRDNLRLDRSGALIYIDIGSDLTQMTSSRFLDMSARLYSIGFQGLDDEEWLRRASLKRPVEVLRELPGFASFYHQLIKDLHPLTEDSPYTPLSCKTQANVTLLIKACAQDAKYLFNQASHIISQLSYPAQFEKILLVIDPFKGPFLRQHSSSNSELLELEAKRLLEQGLINQILIAPDNPAEVQNLYSRWFEEGGVLATHTVKNAPLSAQIWGFEQVKTRFVLQCDSDVLIGRKEWQHDFLSDMLTGLSEPDILCVGFNIPKSKAGFRPYEAQPGEYVPEVRFGLLDLIRIKKCLPVSNPVQKSQYKLTWHRALHKYQQMNNLRSVRGGDSRTFYIHPQNQNKDLEHFTRIRDLISQGIYPNEQAEHFDLLADAPWEYPKRSEQMVFLLKGRQTPLEKLKRCLRSLSQQRNQDFGLILIDDDGDPGKNWHYPILLGGLLTRTTLIRRNSHYGRIPNFIEAIEKVCTNPESLIVILDQDDALMHTGVVELIQSALNDGSDLIQLPMFRPDKPLKAYVPDYENPRKKGGGNVWAHLRAFKKSLFEKIPKAHFICDGEWVSQVTDYVTMLPLAELAQYPIFIDRGYSYYHEREDYSASVKNQQEQLLTQIISLPTLKLK